MTDEAWRGGSGPSPRIAFRRDSGDPRPVLLRTTIMSSPLCSFDGLISGNRALDLDDVLDHAVVDAEGRVLVSMVDVLAMVCLDRRAEVLLVGFVDGASRAFRVADVAERDDVFIQLGIEHCDGPGGGVWTARLWSEDVGTSPVVASIKATTFAVFVGSP
jgi:hypothetical protein